MSLNEYGTEGVMTMVNLAVIGCGHWGPNHIRNFTGLPHSRVVAAVDLCKDRLSAVSGMFPNIQIEQDYHRILEDRSIDAVVIATPTCTHYSIVREALLADKHVLCEKPLCQTSAQAQELIELADSHKLRLMVGHVFLFNSGIMQVKELIDADELGTVQYLTAMRTNLGPIRSDVNAAFDLASHDISVFNWLLGSEPEIVSAMGASLLQSNIEDVVCISLKYPGNKFASVQASWLNPKKVRQMSIIGSKKMLTWNDMDAGQPIAIYDKGAFAQPEYSSFGEFLRISMWDGEVRLPKVKAEEPLKAQSRYFINVITNGTPEKSGGKFSLGVVRALEASIESLKNNGAPVQVAI